jgi:hypothetical protein
MQGERLSNYPINKALIGVLLVGLIIYASTRPTHRLRVDTPEEFLTPAASSTEEEQATENKVARAYWYCVLTAVQPKYGYGESLPVNPPTEFKISATDLGADAADPATRVYYWQRLLQIWHQAGTWRTEREFNLRWVAAPVKSFMRRMQS